MKRRIQAGAPGAGWRTRLLADAWVLTPDPDQSVSSDTRGRVITPPGVAWHLGLADTAVVSTGPAGIVVVRSARILDPAAGEVAAWTG